MNTRGSCSIPSRINSHNEAVTSFGWTTAVNRERVGRVRTTEAVVAVRLMSRVIHDAGIIESIFRRISAKRVADLAQVPAALSASIGFA